MALPQVGDKITAVVHAGRKVFVFSKDWHVVLEDRHFVVNPPAPEPTHLPIEEVECSG